MKYFFGFILIFFTVQAFSQDSSNFTNKEIIYGRKDGMALTLLKLTPAQHSNGKAIIRVVSGNWNSNLEMTVPAIKRSLVFINAGYTVFAVIHGTQPRYSIPDEIEDIRRAVRFVRYNAKEYGIDPDHIGISGASSGGHLSLMTAFTQDKINTNARDAADRVSSGVQAVAVFFPPTDFLNWGASNTKIDRKKLAATGVAGAFDFKIFNRQTGLYETITGDDSIKVIAKNISPVYLVTKNSPPVFIAHGNADKVVPLQQSQEIIKRLNEAAVPNELIIKEGGNHGWAGMEAEEKKFVEWFDKYLK